MARLPLAPLSLTPAIRPTAHLTSSPAVRCPTLAQLILPAWAQATNHLSSPDTFIFDNFSIDFHYLVLAFSGHITGPGLYALEPGVPHGPETFSWSGEFVDMALDYRLVTEGFLTVTRVPET